MKVLVNIRGCNGAGKSTIPMSMMNDPDMYVVEKSVDGKKKKILTVFPTYKWIALGSYLNKTGGMDVLPNKEVKQKALWYALKKFPDYDILMEGVIDSTIFSTYVELFKEVEERYPERKVVIANFLPPFETCIERVYTRNGGKPIKEDAVLSKYKSVERNVKKFKEAGFVSLRLDTSRIRKEDMLRKFLKTVERYKEE